jgi:hypothetical protein
MSVPNSSRILQVFDGSIGLLDLCGNGFEIACGNQPAASLNSGLECKPSLSNGRKTSSSNIADAVMLSRTGFVGMKFLGKCWIIDAGDDDSQSRCDRQ